MAAAHEEGRVLLRGRCGRPSLLQAVDVQLRQRKQQTLCWLVCWAAVKGQVPQPRHACQDLRHILLSQGQASVARKAQIGQAGGGCQAAWQPFKDIVVKDEGFQACRVAVWQLKACMQLLAV